MREEIENTLKYLDGSPDTEIGRENAIALCKSLLAHPDPLAAIDDDALANASIEMWASNDDTTQIAVETIRHYRAALRERINGGVTV